MSLRLPTAESSDDMWFHGAKVLDPKEGRWRNVVTVDLSSLYPNRMIGSNLSPETLVGDEKELAESQWSPDDCIWSYYDARPVKRCENHESWANYRDPDEYKAVRWRDSNGDWQTKWNDEPRPTKLYFLKPSVREGFVRETVGEMLNLKDRYRGTDKYEAVKRICNSVYGVFGTSRFRLFDARLSESITVSGRMVLSFTVETMVEYLDDEFDANATIVGGDTDSNFVAIEGASTRDETIRWAKVATEHVNAQYDDFMKETFGQDEHFMELELESYAPSMYQHSAKKRYAKWETWDDGDDLSDEEDEDSIYYGTSEAYKKAVGEVTIKGFELVRSDVSDLTQEVQRNVFEYILKEKEHAGKQLVYEHLRERIEDVREGRVPLETMGIRSGIGKPLDQYGSANSTPWPIYRGSKYANQNLGSNIGEGSKPMYFPVDRLTDPELPKTYSADTAEDGDLVDYIAVEDTRRLKGKVKIDYEEVVEKQIKGPVEDILENVGWSWNGAVLGHEETSLANFC